MGLGTHAPRDTIATGEVTAVAPGASSPCLLRLSCSRSACVREHETGEPHSARAVLRLGARPHSGAWNRFRPLHARGTPAPAALTAGRRGSPRPGPAALPPARTSLAFPPALRSSPKPCSPASQQRAPAAASAPDGAHVRLSLNHTRPGRRPRTRQAPRVSARRAGTQLTRRCPTAARRTEAGTRHPRAWPHLASCRVTRGLQNTLTPKPIKPCF